MTTARYASGTSVDSSASRAEIERTVCGNGHVLTPENVYVWAKEPWKQRCRECQRERVRRREVRRKAEVNERRDRKLSDWRPVVSPIDLSWAAGLFEGEGTVTINSGGRLGYTRCIARVEMTDPAPVLFFHSIWPGTLRRVVKRSLRTPNASDTLVWNLNSSAKVGMFAEQLLPYVRTDRVRRKLELVIQAEQERSQGSRDPDYKARCQARASEMRELNRRGLAGVDRMGDLLLPDGATVGDRMAGGLAEALKGGALPPLLPMLPPPVRRVDGEVVD